MNLISDMIAKKLGFIDEDGEPTDKPGPKGVKSTGPFKLRHITNGQLRRARIRSIAANRRKESRRYRKTWMRNQLAVAVLRGQLQAVGAIPYVGDVRIDQTSPSYKASKGALEKHYGSVEAALAHYRDIVLEQYDTKPEATA